MVRKGVERLADALSGQPPNSRRAVRQMTTEQTEQWLDRQTGEAIIQENFDEVRVTCRQIRSRLRLGFPLWPESEQDSSKAYCDDCVEATDNEIDDSIIAAWHDWLRSSKVDYHVASREIAQALLATIVTDSEEATPSLNASLRSAKVLIQTASSDELASLDDSIVLQLRLVITRIHQRLIQHSKTTATGNIDTFLLAWRQQVLLSNPHWVLRQSAAVDIIHSLNQPPNKTACLRGELLRTALSRLSYPFDEVILKNSHDTEKYSEASFEYSKIEEHRAQTQWINSLLSSVPADLSVESSIQTSCGGQ